MRKQAQRQVTWGDLPWFVVELGFQAESALLRESQLTAPLYLLTTSSPFILITCCYHSDTLLMTFSPLYVGMERGWG